MTASAPSQTFRAWHRTKRDAKAAKRAQDEDERRRKGILNGREIFMQVSWQRGHGAAQRAAIEGFPTRCGWIPTATFRRCCLGGS